MIDLLEVTGLLHIYVVILMCKASFTVKTRTKSMALLSELTDPFGTQFDVWFGLIHYSAFSAT